MKNRLVLLFESAIKRLPSTLLLLVLCGLSQPAWSEFEEYTLKAVFMEKFTYFVEWPSNSSKVFTLCVIGDNPFNGTLRNLMALTRINNKSTKFIKIDSMDSLPGCDMLFISKSKRDDIARIIEYLQGSPVLTIGDTPGFSQQGVIINFIQKDNEVHFEINSAAAQAAGLKISSRLLKLAIITPPSINSESKD